MNDDEKNQKILRNKKISLLIIVVLLISLFIGYGVNIKSTPESREKKIISFLEKKYHSKFEILQLTKSGENILLPEIGFDGATFCPEIKENGVYYYIYEVRSVTDGVTFEVKYLDKKLDDKIEEVISYYSLVNEDAIVKDIQNYIVDVIGNDNVIVSDRTIEINEKFDNVCDSKYIEQLEKISTYIKQKNTLDKDLDTTMYLKYEDDILVTIGYKDPIVTKRSYEDFEGSEGIDIVSGKYMKVYKSIQEYLER